MRTKKKREKRRDQAVSADRRMREHRRGFGGSAIKPPPGLPQFKPEKSGEYRISVVPFEAGEGNQYSDPGEPYFERTYWQHRNVGVNNEKVLCLAQKHTIYPPCPCYVCQQRTKLGRVPREEQTESQKKAYKDLYASQRQLWLVYDHNDPTKGLQWWDVAFKLFGEHLENKIGAKKDLIDKRKKFADPKVGMIIVINAVKKAIEQNSTLEFMIEDMERRLKPLRRSILAQAQAVCLDDCVNDAIGDPDEYFKRVKETFNASKPEDDEPEDEDEDDEDDDEEDDEGDEDAEDDEDEDEPPCKKGDLIEFRHKGKLMRGKVRKVNEADGLLHVTNKKRPDPKRPWVIEYDEVVTEDEDEPEDEEDPFVPEDEDEPKPPGKKRRK